MTVTIQESSCILETPDYTFVPFTGFGRITYLKHLMTKAKDSRSRLHVVPGPRPGSGPAPRLAEHSAQRASQANQPLDVLRCTEEAQTAHENVGNKVMCCA